MSGAGGLPLVVGVDGTEAGLRAVDWAADEASLRGVPLRLVHASVWEHYEGVSLAQGAARPVEQVMAEARVDAAARRARERRPRLEVSAAVLAEEPARALLREGQYASALVLGSPDRGGVAGLLRGSIGVAVAGHAPCPVVVLRGGNRATAPGGSAARGRVVLGVGAGPAGSAAVRFALAEAGLRRVPLEAVRAWRARRPAGAGAGRSGQAVRVLEEALHDAPSGIEVRLRAVEGSAPRALVHASHEAGLLVVGARRRRGGSRLRPGRVDHTVLHRSACPVAVVPENAPGTWPAEDEDG
ncbi:universal stress protein [Streptomyces sp. NPDC048664]|uniref:universal stress protein n=1 Tax=Streptomyces sp. NPDC048664 TaxID=3154505 RepID=UPI00342F0C74